MKYFIPSGTDINNVTYFSFGSIGSIISITGMANVYSPPQFPYFILNFSKYKNTHIVWSVYDESYKEIVLELI